MSLSPMSPILTSKLKMQKTGSLERKDIRLCVAFDMRINNRCVTLSFGIQNFLWPREALEKLKTKCWVSKGIILSEKPTMQES